jgi:4Fe-4S ferredoxin
VTEEAQKPPGARRRPGAAEKAREAAEDPFRPGEKCRAEPGSWVPTVDRARCEGKRDCVDVCPYSVFEVGPIDEQEYRAMPFFTRLKLAMHGKKTSYTPRASACQACGLCVVACPEEAISLVRRAPA